MDKKKNFTHKIVAGSYNGDMDTIIYMEVKRQLNREEKEAVSSLFRLREVKGRPHLVYVELTEDETIWKISDVRRLALWLAPYLKYSSSIDTVLDSSMQRWLENHGWQSDWERIWPFPEYQEYRNKEYAALLLENALEHIYREHIYQEHKSCTNEQFIMQRNGRLQIPVHLYVLGYEEFVPEALKACIGRIKSLKFIEKSQERTVSRWNVDVYRQLEEYLELLYEEEGMAASKKLLLPGQSFQSLRLECETPAIVLDLSGEDKTAPCGYGKGICWIDMDASDEKQKRLKTRNGGTMYFSMKGEWKRGSFSAYSRV